MGGDLASAGGGNEAKIKEYVSMFSLLNKQKDYKKLQALIDELKALHIADDVVETWQAKLKKAQSKTGFLTSLFNRKNSKLPSASSSVPAEEKPVAPTQKVGLDSAETADLNSISLNKTPIGLEEKPLESSIKTKASPSAPVAEVQKKAPEASISSPMPDALGVKLEAKTPVLTPQKEEGSKSMNDTVPSQDSLPKISPTPVSSKLNAETSGESASKPPVAPPSIEVAPVTASVESLPKKIEQPLKVSVVSKVSEAQTTSPAQPSISHSASKPSEEKGGAEVPKINKKNRENTFTKMFGRDRSVGKSKSVIDQIVASTEKKNVEKSPALLQTKSERQVNRLVSFSKVFANFAAIFIVLTAGFLYIEFLDKDNRVLGAFGVEQNTGATLHQAAETLVEKERQEAILERQIQEFKGGYSDEALNTLQLLTEERINWPDIIAKITEVTNSVYELNDFFQYVQFDNYAFDTERQTIRISGTLSDPQGRNLTKLVELEDAFMNYPRDLNNPNDQTTPYFQDFKELTSLRKTYDEKTGRYTSDFQLSFALSELGDASN